MNAIIKLNGLMDEEIWVNVSFIQQLSISGKYTEVTLVGPGGPGVMVVKNTPIDICRMVREAQAEILRRAK